MSAAAATNIGLRRRSVAGHGRVWRRGRRERENAPMRLGADAPEGVDMATLDIWTYRSRATDMDLTGFTVEAIDGDIGKVDEATYDAGGSYIVVDTGPWIFGKKVMLPAGVIRDLDLDTETVFVNRTKEQIKNAPEFDKATYRSEAYRNELSAYY